MSRGKHNIESMHLDVHLSLDLVGKASKLRNTIEVRDGAFMDLGAASCPSYALVIM